MGDHALIAEKDFYKNHKLVLLSLELLNTLHQSKHTDLHSTFWMGLESHAKKFSKIKKKKKKKNNFSLEYINKHDIKKQKQRDSAPGSQVHNLAI